MPISMISEPHAAVFVSVIDWLPFMPYRKFTHA